jgi:hypothetical protein
MKTLRLGPFWFGFLRGLALPVYMVAGLIYGEGFRAAMRDFREDSDALRRHWRVGEP